MLDQSFANEIKRINNSDKFKLRNELKTIAKQLCRRYEFNDCIKRFGRIKVSICVAATMFANNCDFERNQTNWANEVLVLWKNRTPDALTGAIINIHPSILADNSRELRQLTTLTEEATI